MKTSSNLLDYIFFADDDEDDRDLLEEVLESLCPNAFVKGFNDGVDLLNELRSSLDSLPKIIFLDLNMPRLNGLDFLEVVKNSEALKSISVVVLTTSSSPRDVDRSLQLGALKFLTKPNNYQKFREVLQETLMELY